MKVDYVQSWSGYWFWVTEQAEGLVAYTRRRDAVRGFERFCARVRAM